MGLTVSAPGIHRGRLQTDSVPTELTAHTFCTLNAIGKKIMILCFHHKRQKKKRVNYIENKQRKEKIKIKVTTETENKQKTTEKNQ